MKNAMKIAGYGLLAGAAVTLAGAGMAAAKGHDMRGGFFDGGPAGFFQDVTFADLDVDGNGVITEEDLQATLEARFAEVDTDGSGAISSDEMKAQIEAKIAERMAARQAQAPGQMAGQMAGQAPAAGQGQAQAPGNGQAPMGQNAQPGQAPMGQPGMGQPGQPGQPGMGQPGQMMPPMGGQPCGQMGGHKGQPGQMMGQPGQPGQKGPMGDPSARADQMVAQMIANRDADKDGSLTLEEMAPNLDLGRLIDRFDTDDDNAIGEEEFAAALAEMAGRHGRP